MCVSGRGKGRFQRRFPRAHRLPREAVHQVDADVCKPRRPRHAHGLHGLPRRCGPGRCPGATPRRSSARRWTADRRPSPGRRAISPSSACRGWPPETLPPPGAKGNASRAAASAPGDVPLPAPARRAAAEKHRLHAVRITLSGAYLPAKRGKIRLHIASRPGRRQNRSRRTWTCRTVCVCRGKGGRGALMRPAAPTAGRSFLLHELLKGEQFRLGDDLFVEHMRYRGGFEQQIVSVANGQPRYGRISAWPPPSRLWKRAALPRRTRGGRALLRS